MYLLRLGLLSAAAFTALVLMPAPGNAGDLVPKIERGAPVGAMAQGAMGNGEMHRGGKQGGGMSMPMGEGPAHFAPTREAYTTNHAFLVKLVGLPDPIPYQKHFALKFAVFDGHNPKKMVTDAALTLSAGMRHGMKKGFAHGMNSAPRIRGTKNGIDVQGMYFHMMGKWTLKVTVTERDRRGIAYFDLPCCGK